MSWRAEDFPGPNEAGVGSLWVPRLQIRFTPVMLRPLVLVIDLVINHDLTSFYTEQVSP
jgi:hypothetical protein